MPKSFVHRLKPAARARTQLLLAASMWSVVGAGLCGVGLRWMGQAGSSRWYWWVGAAISLGLAKGHFALRRTAHKAAQRILARGDSTCLGGFLSWQSWLFVLAMMGGGRLLRQSDLPRMVLGGIYVAVGIALLWGCRVFWEHWQKAA